MVFKQEARKVHIGLLLGNQLETKKKKPVHQVKAVDAGAC